MSTKRGQGTLPSGELARSWTSPFSALPRWEVEYPHFYHLPTDTLDELRAEGSVYLLGTRGTGKTTLLMSLEWAERLENRDLADLVGPPSADGLIGLYQKVPEARFELLDASFTGSDAERFVAAYFDCFSIQLMANAILGLRSAGDVGLSASSERRVSELLLEALGAELLPRQIASLRDVEDAAHGLAQALEDAAEGGLPLDLVGMGTLSRYRVGGLSRGAADAIVAALRDECPGKPWRFRHCLDEAEGLSVRQQRALGALLRLARHSLTYVAAFTQVAAEPSATGLPFLDLSEHDVRTMSLDWFEDNAKDYTRALDRFERLAGGVLEMRLRAWDEAQGLDEWAPRLTHEQVVLQVKQRVLPRLDIDGRLNLHLDGADLPLDHAIFEAARVAPGEEASRDVSLSYKAYLRHAGHGESHGSSGEARRQDNAEFRKRMIAAYLSICELMNWEPIYCGWDEILQLSDLCIRDFIWQMRELWREANPVSGAKFLEHSISVTAQSHALKRASNKKVAFSRKYLTVSPARTRRLVEGLAILTRELQANHRDRSTLASPERGDFVLNRSVPTGGSSEEIISLITDAARQGYLKIVDSSEVGMTFRVHRCLAPLAGFSYRRPQYSFRIRPREVIDLSEAKTEAELRHIVALVADPSHDQISLFGDDA